MRIFISSVIRGMEQFRSAAEQAIVTLQHEPIMAESFAAAPSTPQQTCLAGVRSGDATVLLLGERYGPKQASGLSATHEEFREAQSRHPVFVFVQKGVTYEPDQARFVLEVQDWAHGRFTAQFRDAGDLERQITTGLHRHELSQVQGAVDTRQLLEVGQSLLPPPRVVTQQLCVIVVGGPLQTILRPAELVASELKNMLLREAMFGAHPVINHNDGARDRIEDNSLILENPRSQILMNQFGTVRILQPALYDGDSGPGKFLSVLIEEQVRERTKAALEYIAGALDHIDSLHRLSDIVPIVALLNCGHAGWRTVDEHARSPNQMTMGRARDKEVVSLTPPDRRRGTLRREIDGLVEDFTILLRQRMKATN